MTTVQSQTGKNITRVGTATDTKSDRSEFVLGRSKREWSKRANTPIHDPLPMKIIFLIYAWLVSYCVVIFKDATLVVG